jgi:hypothetical protein
MSGRIAVILITGLVATALVQGCSKKTPTQPKSDISADALTAQTSSETATVISSSGAIEGDVAQFRTLLGDPNNGAAPGQQPAGRREVNWDGVPASVTNTDDFPNDFFNTTSPRGLFYVRKGHGLEVSDRGFTDVNPDYAGVFNTFSAAKLFSPIGKNEAEARFFVAGTGTKAAVRGFGLVFCDVDKAGSTFIELRGAHGEDLGKFTAPVRSDDRGLSFIGVVFDSPMISRVRITSGEERIEADEKDITQGGRHDLVVMDNFLFGEPMAIED